MAKKTPYGRGRRSISNAPGGGNYAEKWHQKLDYLEKPKNKKPKEIRIVGGLFTIFQHFVRFKRKDGSKGGFYEVCPDFDWETGEFRKGPDAVCPLCADFQADDLPQDLRLLGSFRYYMDVFDVSAAKEGRKDGLFGVVFTNKYGKNDLATIGDILGAEVDDLKNGCTVHWHYNDKAQDPKDRVRFYQGNKLPVGFDEDKGVFVLKGGGMRFEGNPTPFDEIVEVKSADDIRADLKRLGLYKKLDEVLEVVASREENTGGRGNASRDASSGGWGDNEQSEEPRRQRQQRSSGNKGGSKQESFSSDSGWGDDSSGSEELETAPADEGWGDDSQASSSSSNEGWGEESSSSSSDEGWGEDSSSGGNGASDEGWGEESKASSSDDSWGEAPSGGGDSAPTHDDSFFGSDEGWGDDSSSGSSSKSSGDDPDGW